MKSRTRAVTLLTVVVILALGIGVTGISGCGGNTAQMQEFVDGYLSVVEQLESKPEVAQEGQQAAMAYATSGYTDLESAAIAQESYEVSSENDQAALKELENLEAPDEETEAIANELKAGVETVDKGNQKFASDLAKAKDQTVEERAATAQDIQPAMNLYVEGMTMIVTSLEKLQEYVESNGLDNGETVKKWLDRIEGELESVKKYSG